MKPSPPHCEDHTHPPTPNPAPTPKIKPPRVHHVFVTPTTLLTPLSLCRLPACVSVCVPRTYVTLTRSVLVPITVLTPPPSSVVSSSAVSVTKTTPPSLPSVAVGFVAVIVIISPCPFGFSVTVPPPPAVTTTTTVSWALEVNVDPAEVRVIG